MATTRAGEGKTCLNGITADSPTKSLTDLPTELLEHILCFSVLQDIDICNVSCCCKRLQDVCHGRGKVWENQYKLRCYFSVIPLEVWCLWGYDPLLNQVCLLSVYACPGLTLILLCLHNRVGDFFKPFSITNLLMQKIHHLSRPLASFCMLRTHLNALAKGFVANLSNSSSL